MTLEARLLWLTLTSKHIEFLEKLLKLFCVCCCALFKIKCSVSDFGPKVGECRMWWLFLHRLCRMLH